MTSSNARLFPFEGEFGGKTSHFYSQTGFQSRLVGGSEKKQNFVR